MVKYRNYIKKPIVVQAVQWVRDGDHPMVREPIIFPDPNEMCAKCNQPLHRHGWIDTLEGGHVVCVGDYIIKGVEGEFYPCKPDIFKKTYKPEDGGVW